MSLDIRALIDGPAHRQRWIRLTQPGELNGLDADSVIRVKGQSTTVGVFGPFLSRMVQSGVKVELPW